jgi:hypothetical protein
MNEIERTIILHIYTIIHTLISLVAIVTGLVVLFGLLAGKRLDGWTKWFLITTVATTVTGFGAWRWIYTIGAVISLYFNLFVLVVQAFEKVPFLHAMAPTQAEGPFKLTQLIVLALFVMLGIAALIRFRPEPARSA